MGTNRLSWLPQLVCCGPIFQSVFTHVDLLPFEEQCASGFFPALTKFVIALQLYHLW